MLELDKKETYISDIDKDKKHVTPPEALLGVETYTYCGKRYTPKIKASSSPLPYCTECVFRCNQDFLSRYGETWFK